MSAKQTFIPKPSSLRAYISAKNKTRAEHGLCFCLFLFCCILLEGFKLCNEFCGNLAAEF